MGWPSTFAFGRVGIHEAVRAGSCEPALTLLRRSRGAFLRIDNAQAFDGLEPAVFRLTDVHVHPDAVLTWHHLSRTARPVGDTCVVKRGDDIVLPERARLVHC